MAVNQMSAHPVSAATAIRFACRPSDEHALPLIIAAGKQSNPVVLGLRGQTGVGWSR